MAAKDREPVQLWSNQLPTISQRTTMDFYVVSEKGLFTDRRGEKIRITKIWGWQNTLMPCLELDHFMTKQIDTMSGAWPFHAESNWYYIWGLTISWQKRLILTYLMSGPRHGINLFCHEMVKLQTWHQCVLAWNDQSPDMVSVGFGMKWSSPRHSICLFCHEMVKLQT
jgi:hypothetical protein